jgi:Protein of unknown function (DUF3775)
MQLSKVAREVIRKAEAIRTYWDTELPRRHPDYPIVNLGEDSGPPPPEERELHEFLAGLPDELVYQLLLLTCLGRGDFGASDLASHYELLKGKFRKPREAVSWMMGKGPLAEYLVDGLAELKHSKIDVDKMVFRPARSRKAR